MFLTFRRASALVLAAASTLLAVPVHADGSFPAMLNDFDQKAYARLPEARVEFRDFAHKHGKKRDVKVLDEVLAGKPVALTPAQMAGEWRCRTLLMRVDPEVALDVRPEFKCRITDDAAGLRLETLTGPYRLAGTFYDIGKTELGFAGAQAWNDEPKAPRYDAQPLRNQAGVLTALSPQRMRLELTAVGREDAFYVIDLRR